MILGEQIYLTALDPANADQAWRWFTDPEVIRFLYPNRPFTRMAAERFYEETEKEAWGEGYAADAVRVCLRIVFYTLGLHRVYLTCAAENDRALPMYARMGFREVGVQREAMFKEGRYIDLVVFDMLDREFRELYGDWDASRTHWPDAADIARVHGEEAGHAGQPRATHAEEASS
jgi:RimJ/RimL family protein N-acetyltransferase